jgi:hypothetical protein
LRLSALATSKAIRHTKPKGITSIGTIPKPAGTEPAPENEENRITRIARTDAITLPMKPIARYFSRTEALTGVVFEADRVLEESFLAILLEYWLS